MNKNMDIWIEIDDETLLNLNYIEEIRKAPHFSSGDPYWCIEFYGRGKPRKAFNSESERDAAFEELKELLK